MSERTPAGSSTHGHNLARLIFDHCSDRLGWHAQAWELAGKVMIEESLACCADCGHTRDRHVGNDKHEESCDEDGCGCVVFARDYVELLIPREGVTAPGPAHFTAAIRERIREAEVHETERRLLVGARYRVVAGISMGNQPLLANGHEFFATGNEGGGWDDHLGWYAKVDGDRVGIYRLVRVDDGQEVRGAEFCPDVDTSDTNDPDPKMLR
jgi:hypothetical protein